MAVNYCPLTLSSFENKNAVMKLATSMDILKEQFPTLTSQLNSVYAPQFLTELTTMMRQDSAGYIAGRFKLRFMMPWRTNSFDSITDSQAAEWLQDLVNGTDGGSWKNAMVYSKEMLEHYVKGAILLNYYRLARAGGNAMVIWSARENLEDEFGPYWEQTIHQLLNPSSNGIGPAPYTTDYIPEGYVHWRQTKGYAGDPTNPDNQPHPAPPAGPDVDFDGIPTVWEAWYGLDYLHVTDGGDPEEFVDVRPRAPDSIPRDANGKPLPPPYSATIDPYGFLKVGYITWVNLSHFWDKWTKPIDPDGDGLCNLMEFWLGTNPLIADTDGDGINDGVEYKKQTSPVNPAEKPTFVGTPPTHPMDVDPGTPPNTGGGGDPPSPRTDAPPGTQFTMGVTNLAEMKFELGGYYTFQPAHSPANWKFFVIPDHPQYDPGRWTEWLGSLVNQGIPSQLEWSCDNLLVWNFQGWQTNIFWDRSFGKGSVDSEGNETPPPPPTDTAFGHADVLAFTANEQADEARTVTAIAKVNTVWGNPGNAAGLGVLVKKAEEATATITIQFPPHSTSPNSITVNGGHGFPTGDFRPVTDTAGHRRLLVNCQPPDVFTTRTYEVSVRQVEVLQHPASETNGSPEPPVTQKLRLCRWLDAYDSLGDLATTYPRVERDRFHIRIPASVAPHKNKIIIKVSTKRPSGTNDAEDNPTEIECEKSGGYFISKPLILVGDDDDASWNQVGPGNNQLNDATHLASPGGKVEIEISDAGTSKFEVPIAPFTDTISVETWVVRSPSSAAKLPANLPNLVMDGMKRAKEIFRQVHVKLNYTGPFECVMTDAEIDEINKDYGNSDPARHMIIEGANANFLNAEAQTVFDKVVAAGAAGTDVVKIVFMDCDTIQRSPSNTAWTVQDDDAKHGAFEGYIVVPYQHADLTHQLAHEIGHAARLDHPSVVEAKSFMLMYRHNIRNASPFVEKRFRPVDLDQMLATPRPPFVKPSAP